MNREECRSEKGSKNVEDYTKVASIGKILNDMEFSADENKIIQYVRLPAASDTQIKIYCQYFRIQKINNIRMFLRLAELLGWLSKKLNCGYSTTNEYNDTCICIFCKQKSNVCH